MERVGRREKETKTYVGSRNEGMGSEEGRFEGRALVEEGLDSLEPDGKLNDFSVEERKGKGIKVATKLTELIPPNPSTKLLHSSASFKPCSVFATHETISASCF